MQFIHIHLQDKNIIEKKKRKVFNILIYSCIYIFTIIIFTLILIYSVFISLINKKDLITQSSKLYNEIYNLSNIRNDEILIPVINNNKYGFINELGNEIISPEYDKVSFFYSTKIHNTDCYFSLAQKNSNFYLISKDNSKINITDYKHFKNIYNVYNKISDKRLEELTPTHYMYMILYSYIYGTNGDIKLETEQRILEKEKYNFNGDKKIFNNGYSIERIINDIIIFHNDNVSGYNDNQYYIANLNGEILIDSIIDYFILSNETLILVNNNIKMTMYNLNLEQISNEYDGILYDSYVVFRIKKIYNK